MTYLESLERDYSLSVKEGWLARVDAPARVRPDQLTTAAMAQLTTAERLRYEEQRSVWHANLGPILTPQVNGLVAELDEIIEANRQDGDKVKSSALLDAYPGLGKTTLAVMFAAGFHRRQVDIYGPTTAEGHERVPVAWIGLTSNTSMRSFNSMLCRFYGHPGAERGNATQLANRAADCVSSCKTRLIVVDDVHFLDMNRRDGREVANHFKWLSNQFPVTFMYVGVGLRHRHLLNEGLTASDRQFAQTARRWTRLSLSPFEIGTDEGRRDWRRLLLAIERDLVLADARPGDLANDLADYLYVRSTGHFASLMTYITRGCHRAATTGEERLTKDLIDHIRNDEAAEAARIELQAAIDHGLLSARARPNSGAA
ncbi:MAG: ATP-binding protein [Actinomycetota bacterium]|nr:ATP-binding protein [Actinomycetota bacterium]